MRAFFIAVQFMTRIPVPMLGDIGKKEIGFSVLFFPLVGLLIGLILVAVGHFPSLSVSATAVVLLIVATLINGALHLDGLGDSADAWLSGAKKTRALEIMQDSHIGSAGVVSIVLILLAKYVFLLEINILELLIMPVVSRTMPIFLMLKFNYVRENGIARDMVDFVPRKMAMAIVMMVLSIVVWVNWMGVLMMLVGLFFLVRTMQARLGGWTGDVLGAVIEISEVLFLLGCIL